MARNIIRQAGDLGGKGLKAGLSTMGDFRKFILRGNVVDLAVGVVIGAAFNGVVQDFVKVFITPLIQWATGSNSNDMLNNWVFTLPNSEIKIQIGTFLSSFLSFLIVAAVVYFFVVRPVNLLEEGYRRILKIEDEVTTKPCPYCYSDIPKKATRCGFCTSHLDEAVPTTDAQVKAKHS